MTKNLLAICLLFLLSFVPRSNVRNAHPDRPHSAAGPLDGGQAAPTIGFFLDSWKPKDFVVPSFNPVAPPVGATTTLTIEADSVITRIPPSEFSHNVDYWIGTMASQPTFLTNVTNLNPHVLRWPGGSASDGYFWNRAPGQWPADVPDFLPDASGKNKATRISYGRPGTDKIASVDDYYAMLKTTGAQGLITVNYGYARYGTSANPVATAAHLAADWVRYDHGRTHYWEIGNENNGFWEYGYRIDTTLNKDGQPKMLTGELYGRHFRVFADSMRKAAAEVGATIYIGAVTGEGTPKPWDPPLTRNWNAGMMKTSNNQADYYVVHSYFTPYNQNTSAHDILYYAASTPGSIMDYVAQSLRTNGAAVKPIALDEWNMFAEGSHQQVSNISGLFGVIVLGEAMRNKFGLAARWDLFNSWNSGNDHGLFSAGDEPGIPRWSPRPSFYYLYYFQRMMGDQLVQSHITGDTTMHAYASRFSSGELGAAIVNTDTVAKTITIEPKHAGQTAAHGTSPHARPAAGAHYYWYTLEGGNDNGEFSARVFVNGKGPDAAAGGPTDYATLKANAAATSGRIRVTVPARGAVFLVIGK